jgi:hypothetical protein
MFQGHLEFAKFISSDNKDATYKDKFERGGTLTVCQGNLCARTYAYGTEKTILGRWSWIKIRGRQGLSIVIATVYRPVKSDGVLSTYQQHQSVLLDLGIDACPRQQLLENLSAHIKIWISEGNQIIIAGDFNEDVRSKTIKFFWEIYK